LHECFPESTLSDGDAERADMAWTGCGQRRIYGRAGLYGAIWNALNESRLWLGYRAAVAAVWMCLKGYDTSGIGNVIRGSRVPCQVGSRECSYCNVQRGMRQKKLEAQLKSRCGSPFSAAFFADLGLPSNFLLVRPTVFLNQL
jgi:hypothetical protein